MPAIGKVISRNPGVRDDGKIVILCVNVRHGIPAVCISRTACARPSGIGLAMKRWMSRRWQTSPWRTLSVTTRKGLPSRREALEKRRPMMQAGLGGLSRRPTGRFYGTCWAVATGAIDD